jgi:ATP-dependent exoDNAse (exonuclease V) alpha subunit
MAEFEYVFVILSLRLLSKRLALRAVTRARQRLQGTLTYSLAHYLRSFYLLVLY